jgi:membrane fusion protein (multidrug efflux system)
MSRAKKRGVWIGSILAIVVLAAGGTFFLQQKTQREAAAAEQSPGSEEDGKKEKRVPVELAAVSSRSMPNYFTATGTLEAKRSVDLISKAQGEIVRLAVEEGQLVRAGDILLELDHREQELAAGKAGVLSKTATAEYERVQGIATHGLATDRELEAARQNSEVNEFDFALAEKQLADRIVRAPFDGLLAVRHVERGQTVGVGEKILTLAQVSPMELRLYLPEAVVREIEIGQPVHLSSDVTGEHFEGAVDRIAPVVDAATSTVKVTIRVDEATEKLRAGSFVRARITTSVHDQAIAVPKRALVPEAGANFVFVAEADSVRKVEVRTGFAADDHIEVLEGLSGGETIVVAGQGGLRNGSPIRDLDAPEPVEEAVDEAKQEMSEDDGSTSVARAEA